MGSCDPAIEVTPHCQDTLHGEEDLLAQGPARRSSWRLSTAKSGLRTPVVPSSPLASTSDHQHPPQLGFVRPEVEARLAESRLPMPSKLPFRNPREGRHAEAVRGLPRGAAAAGWQRQARGRPSRAPAMQPGAAAQSRSS
nr:unnamed protein product [Digitaria exilis]